MISARRNRSGNLAEANSRALQTNQAIIGYYFTSHGAVTIITEAGHGGSILNEEATTRIFYPHKLIAAMPNELFENSIHGS